MLLFRSADFITDPGGYCCSISAEARSLCMHTHDFYEIAYVMEGWGIHHTDTASQMIREGDFLFLSPGASHCIVSSPDESIPRVRICNCLFTAAFFQPVIRRFLDLTRLKDTSLFRLLSAHSPFCLFLPDNEAQAVRTSVRSIQQEINRSNGPSAVSGRERPDPTYSSVIIANHLLSFLLETGRIYDSRLNHRLLTGRNDRMLQELTDFIRSNLDLPLTLPALAQRVHFSPEYLSRYFKRHTGQTLHSYILLLRMKKAEDLLLHTSYPITEIGYLCGFTSASNFRKYFTKNFGVSPREYRKQHLSYCSEEDSGM